MQEKVHGLTISQWRRRCSKLYTALDRMVSLKIHSDIVPLHPWTVIDQAHCNITYRSRAKKGPLTKYDVGALSWLNVETVE